MDGVKHPQVELRDGETVWAAWSNIAYGGEPRVFCDAVVVISGEHRLVRRADGRHGSRQLSGFEATFATEAEARAWLASELAVARDRIQQVIREQASLAAAGRVVYAS